MGFNVSAIFCRWPVLALAGGALCGSVCAQSAKLTISGVGGDIQKEISKTVWQPAAEKAGVSIREESNDGTLAQIRLQVQSGKPGWDIVNLGSADCAVGASDGLFEPIDYKVVNVDGIQQEWRAANWVGMSTYSVVLAWNTEKYKAKPPRNWVDFWNVGDFPGRRGLSSAPSETLEIALLGDGVQKEELYPLDVKRALASISKLRKDVAVWYATGAQSAQLIKDGEVDMIAIYGSRVASVLKDGAPISYTFQDGVLSTICMAIVKGSRNLAASQRFVAEALTPAIQARIPTMMPYYGPVNTKAYEVGKFSPEILAQSNIAPVNKVKQVALKVDWWRDHIKEVAGPFKQLISN